MTTVPAVFPVTVPEADPTVATTVLELDQTPPVNRSVRSVEDPEQTLNIPLIGVGIPSTVAVVVIKHPLAWV